MTERSSPAKWDWMDAYDKNPEEKVISGVSKLQEISRHLNIDPKQPDPHQLLMLAIEKTNENVLNALIGSFKININQRDAKGRTALTQAVKAGNRDMVECLLEIQGIDVNAPDEDGITPLWLSLRNHVSRDHRMIAAAIIQKADVNERDGNGDYSITWAIRNNIDSFRDSSSFHSDWQRGSLLIPLLIKKKELDVERIESVGQSPFLSAINCESLSRLDDFLKDLLDFGKFNVNILDGDFRSPLSLAVEKSTTWAVNALLENAEVDVCSQDKDGRTPLIWSIITGRFTTMQLLLEREDSGINTPDMNGRTPLSWASGTGNLDMLEFLLQKCADNVDEPDLNGQTPLFWAVQREPEYGSLHKRSRGFDRGLESQNEQIVKYLINSGGADPYFKDNNKRTPLSWAVTTKNLDIVEYLIEYQGCNINDSDKDGRTPLSWSAEQGDIEVVRYLLSIDGVDANIEDHEKRSPLFWATRPKNETMIKHLLLRDMETLHILATKGTYVEKVKLLLEAGYDSSKLDGSGQTPLHRAVRARNLDFAKLCIKYCHSSVNKKDKKGITPLQLAVTYSPHMLALLVESSAQTNEIQRSAWFNGNDGESHSIVCLSLKGEDQSLQFISRNQFSANFGQDAWPMAPGICLFLSKESPPPWSRDGFFGFKQAPKDDMLHVNDGNLIPGFIPHVVLYIIKALRYRECPLMCSDPMPKLDN
ncbi:hypothetical protein FOXG_21801 [Fusarium oxysporum f. sp. lycopersici 4287]|uniref:Uncharacterized protein n=1 Tax=Fusarium oxysporum f. sp. lycopersici (strain 4287 / CBS 123668 / FGSC 9935 / NRRL 34936) TaxID=426428 RepID=A0A0J9W1K4_FUSO4|nr:hypothetical protein FOXG_21801 [Fusarium oxysporum f. sp. lycopersici 4287]KNB16811.1 hypothetical protein FOXG_21801 [Fusarium oxysporum f. sp. lycopersici 4287]